MKMRKQACTTEFKELAVKRVRGGQGVSTVCGEPGRSDQTLRNWIKTAAEGQLWCEVRLDCRTGEIVLPD